MNEVESIFENPQYKSDAVNKVNVFTGSDLTTDTYYFMPHQILEYHMHPDGDQVFIFLQGKGKFFLDNGTESVINVAQGSSVYVPSGVWHKIENSDNEMVAVQVTKAGAGFSARH